MSQITSTFMQRQLGQNAAPDFAPPWQAVALERDIMARESTVADREAAVEQRELSLASDVERQQREFLACKQQLAARETNVSNREAAVAAQLDEVRQLASRVAVRRAELDAAEAAIAKAHAGLEARIEAAEQLVGQLHASDSKFSAVAEAPAAVPLAPEPTPMKCAAPIAAPAAPAKPQPETDTAQPASPPADRAAQAMPQPASASPLPASAAPWKQPAAVSPGSGTAQLPSGQAAAPGAEAAKPAMDGLPAQPQPSAVPSSTGRASTRALAADSQIAQAAPASPMAALRQAAAVHAGSKRKSPEAIESLRQPETAGEAPQQWRHRVSPAAAALPGPEPPAEPPADVDQPHHIGGGPADTSSSQAPAHARFSHLLFGAHLRPPRGSLPPRPPPGGPPPPPPPPHCSSSMASAGRLPPRPPLPGPFHPADRQFRSAAPPRPPWGPSHQPKWGDGHMRPISHLLSNMMAAAQEGHPTEASLQPQHNSWLAPSPSLDPDAPPFSGLDVPLPPPSPPLLPSFQHNQQEQPAPNIPPPSVQHLQAASGQHGGGSNGGGGIGGGERGSVSNDSKPPRQRGKSRGRKGNGLRCKDCGSRRHHANDCLEAPVCSHCIQHGHGSNSCPELQLHTGQGASGQPPAAANAGLAANSADPADQNTWFAEESLAQSAAWQRSGPSSIAAPAGATPAASSRDAAGPNTWFTEESLARASVAKARHGGGASGTIIGRGGHCGGSGSVSGRGSGHDPCKGSGAGNRGSGDRINGSIPGNGGSGFGDARRDRLAKARLGYISLADLLAQQRQQQKPLLQHLLQPRGKNSGGRGRGRSADQTPPLLEEDDDDDLDDAVAALRAAAAVPRPDNPESEPAAPPAAVPAQTEPPPQPPQQPRQRQLTPTQQMSCEAAHSALAADAPDLWESLMAHGIAERLALLDVDGGSGGNRSGTAEGTASARRVFSDVVSVLQRLLLPARRRNSIGLQAAADSSGGSLAADADAVEAPGVGEAAESVAAGGSGVATGRAADLRPLAALQALIDLAEESTSSVRPVQWGWCRELRAFIFVFEEANRIVIETPQWGNATYFFELESPMPVALQVQRLIAVLSLKNVSKGALLSDEPLHVGRLQPAELAALTRSGWVPGTGLRSLLNFTGERIPHHHYLGEGLKGRKHLGPQCPWRERVTNHLREAAAGGRVHRSGAAAAAASAAGLPLPD